MGQLVGKAFTLVNLAGYQEGSVVSRTIVDKKTGTVTFFAFDKGQGSLSSIFSGTPHLPIVTSCYDTPLFEIAYFFGF